MSAPRRALLVLAAHLALAGVLYGHLAVARAVHPRAWVRVRPYDPVDPLRGRYVRLSLEPVDGRSDAARTRVVLTVEDGRVVAHDAPAGAAGLGLSSVAADSGTVVLADPVAIFIPEHIPDPSRVGGGRELWVEVSVPPGGRPLPLRWEERPAGLSAPAR